MEQHETPQEAFPEFGSFFSIFTKLLRSIRCDVNH